MLLFLVLIRRSAVVIIWSPVGLLRLVRTKPGFVSLVLNAGTIEAISTGMVIGTVRKGATRVGIIVPGKANSGSTLHEVGTV